MIIVFNFFKFISGSMYLYLYLDERRGVQETTRSMRSKEFPRAQPEEPPEIEYWYFPVRPKSSQGTDIIEFKKVIKPVPSTGTLLAGTSPRACTVEYLLLCIYSEKT